MSSSGGGETFTIGSHVDVTDGPCGHLARVIVDPATQTLTHLVVEHGHEGEFARLVPVDLVSSVEGDVIRLSCTKERFEQLDAAEDVEFLPADTSGFGYGGGAAGGLGGSLGHSRKPMFSDRVPAGEVDIRRDDPVRAKDGWVGKVHALVIDPADNHVTHVLLQEGHLWGRKEVAIPIGAANRVDFEVHVDLTKDEIEALPPVSRG
jgi:hypothetical protein